ncbi:MAG TPA: adenylosuccinate synthetase [Nitrososphaeraceae archaeon]|nr:adenylosuccinate synthetase [Nitrososphaeraceae archaeon]
MPCNVVVGGFFGDEGKGKIIAYLVSKDDIKLAARGGVGPNAGHTFSINGKTFKVRMLPSAAFNVNTTLAIGAGVLVNPTVLLNEISTFNAHNRTFIDFQCGIITDEHIKKDSSDGFLKDKVGTTGTGTGPANSDRALRKLSIARECEQVKDYLTDVSTLIHSNLEKQNNVLLEGTQGTYLSLYHGGYPYVTSKDVTASSICADIGIGPKNVDEVLVVFKSYVTRVGGGPLQNELDKEESKKRGWIEYGSVTGRERRSSPFNIELAKKAIMLNGGTSFALTKMDVLYPESAGITDYSKLPSSAKKFVEEIESELGIKAVLIGTGAEVNAIIDRRDNNNNNKN